MAGFGYAGLAEEQWLDRTRQLIEAHPLKTTELIEVVLQAWNDIFESKLGSKGFQIGKHIFPKPQIMGFFLHELIPLELAARYPNEWRGEKDASDKDVVYIPTLSSPSRSKRHHTRRRFSETAVTRRKATLLGRRASPAIIWP